MTFRPRTGLLYACAAILLGFFAFCTFALWISLGGLCLFGAIATGREQFDIIERDAKS